MGMVATCWKLILGQRTAIGKAQHTFVEVQQRRIPYGTMQRPVREGRPFAAKQDNQEIGLREMVEAVGLEVVLVGSSCSRRKKPKKNKMQNAEKLVFGG